MLLNAYSIMDHGVLKDIEREKVRGRVLACRKGCSNCCKTHRDIPIYPIEIVGIYWFVCEKIDNPLREKIRLSLIEHNSQRPCPFVIDGVCSIYPMRPLACRQFNVFGRPCSEGEDAYYTRKQDVLVPSENYLGRALYETAPFYGVFSEQERLEFINSGRLNSLVKVLRQYPWIELARRMR